MLIKHSTILALLILGLCLVGCSKDDEITEQESELALYQSAQSGMNAGNYKEAVIRLQALEAR